MAQLGAGVHGCLSGKNAMQLIHCRQILFLCPQTPHFFWNLHTTICVYEFQCTHDVIFVDFVIWICFDRGHAYMLLKVDQCSKIAIPAASTISCTVLHSIVNVLSPITTRSAKFSH